MIERATRPPWMEQATLLERAAKALILTVASVIVIYPFITVVATSLATQQEIPATAGSSCCGRASRASTPTALSSPAGS